MLQIIGGPVPPNTDHAVSVSLPTWKANVAYEEGESWVTSSMQCGYPRFFIHPVIQELAAEIVRRFGTPKYETAMLFPSTTTAELCRSFMKSRLPVEHHSGIRIMSFSPSHQTDAGLSPTDLLLSSVIYPKEFAPVAKQVWQHTGNGISSRRGEFCLGALKGGFLIERNTSLADTISRRICKGPRRYQGRDSISGVSRSNGIHNQSQDLLSTGEAQDGKEYVQFIEERFGRNLNVSLADQARLAVRRRIAGVLTADVELSEALEKTEGEGRVAGLTDADVFLYPTGMSSIFNAHQMLLSCRGQLKSVCFGFPYIDSLKILEKWGPGCLFYGQGSSDDLDDLESRLQAGERFLALFTEFPGNPLLKSPDLKRIRQLADEYDFAVVIDETVGNFLNINVLSSADIVVSSLTKIFSGDSNVMGGSAVLNPHGQFYQSLKRTFAHEYEDNVWAEDAVFLERNSRDFASRIEKINKTTEVIAELLLASPLIKNVYYPKFNPSKHLYEAYRTPTGGYGGLFSVTFHSTEEAMAFFDQLEVHKGPSLGTNFTLSCPYTLLAHYGELEWANSFGVEYDLVRISVGLEEESDLCNRIRRALVAVSDIRTQ
ncbi:cystathionine gamma-synthase [Aspergillus saccharolyticus JOP 1030-1]|uniref:cystathionine gamma-synthase n=1 Tax=Aspergillus saccharolyticus JOP 1030-1 TaxID=1450539 RepID=A0A318Z8P1_9EURO|nr:putative cystathionine gamma-synthase [Aspergillus saccharolyticus JOP 1030-1]PYH41143.1 putative cystathionine gamma-synthase [Aspergillus saccharolyticus JOP 1030-1]